MSTLCSQCGIAEMQSDGKKWCLKFQIEVSDGSKDAKLDCYYFIEPQFDDGEHLTARENLMIKECELVSRKMRGPV